MKRLLLVIAFALLFVATGATMRTPITRPGFDNIPTLIELENTQLKIVDNATEQTLYSVIIPRRTLGLDNRVVKVELEYWALNNTGGNRNIAWGVYYGGSGLWLPPDAWTSSAAERSGRIVVWLINEGDPLHQRIFARDESVSFINGELFTNVDSSTDKELKITVDFDAANVNLWIERQVALTTQMSP